MWHTPRRMFKIRLLPTLPSLLSAPQRPLIHRDLSWLQFNERVLDEARASSGNPILERVKYLAITASNLDEFFMIRLASLGKTIRRHLRYRPVNFSTNRRLEGIRSAILENVAKFGARQAEVLDLLTTELAAANIYVVKRSGDSELTKELGKRVFERDILSKLSPPENFDVKKLTALENLQIGIVFPGGLWFRIPRSLPQVLRVEDVSSEAVYFFFLDDLLTTYLGSTFGLPGKPGLLRLTRDADFTADLEEEDPASIPDIVRSGLGSRERGVPVRLQYGGDLAPGLLPLAQSALRLIPGQVLPGPYTFNLQGLWTVVKETPENLASRDGLSYPALRARLPRSLAPGNGTIFDKLKQRDLLLHHPFDSFDAFVAFIDAAAKDPSVQMIEQTVYRVDALSPLINILKEAAKRKRVRVIIELRARFDEYNNLRMADELRKAGAEVAYGFGKLKLHAKIALVTRREAGGIRMYTHLSTGNYNATTAKMYTDLAILTANQEIGADAKLFFEAASKGEVPQGFKHLVSAPMRLHRRLLTHIQAETQAARAGEKTRIVAKVNALVDEAVVDALYAASQAGVQVDLIVRGACSLIPGVKGLSENIRVISVVDRFLEHSRIYFFESQKAMYLSSADWMPRNFFSRLEIAFPVLDPKIYKFIAEILIPTYFADNLKARELTHQGIWKKRVSKAGAASVRSQFVFEKLAVEEYNGTPLD